MFLVDNIQWEFPCDIERTAEIVSSDISGMMMDTRYFNDVIGTYMKYTVTIVVPFGKENEYSQLYQVLSDPLADHGFEFPYNESTIYFFGRITNIKDVYRKLPDGTIHWRGIQFDAIANHASRTRSLDDVLTRGLTPLPDIAGAKEGVLYIYNGSSWVEITYDDADGKAY